MKKHASSPFMVAFISNILNDRNKKIDDDDASVCIKFSEKGFPLTIEATEIMLFTYLSEQLMPGKDYVYVEIEQYHKDYPFDMDKIKEVFVKFCEIGLLAPSDTKRMYYVNSDMMFRSEKSGQLYLYLKM